MYNLDQVRELMGKVIEFVPKDSDVIGVENLVDSIYKDLVSVEKKLKYLVEKSDYAKARLEKLKNVPDKSATPPVKAVKKGRPKGSHVTSSATPDDRLGG